MKDFKPSVKGPVESFAGKSNREIVEAEESKLATDDMDISQDQQGTVSPGILTAPSGPGY